MTNATLAGVALPTTVTGCDGQPSCTLSAARPASRIVERRIAARFGLSIPTARVICDLAGLGDLGEAH
jgi:hypothetical protein